MNAKIIFLLSFFGFLFVFLIYHILIQNYKRKLSVCQEKILDLENSQNKQGVHISHFEQVHHTDNLDKNDDKNINYDVFDKVTKRKSNGELPCMDVYLNDQYNQIKGNQYFDKVSEKEEEDEIKELANKEYQYIGIKEKEINGDISNISSHPSPNYEKGRKLISSVYDVENKCKIKDLSHEKSQNEKIERFENNPLHPFTGKIFYKKSDDFKFHQDNIKLYLINMKKSIERFKRFQDAYTASDLASIEFERIEGVNGKEIDIKNYVSDKAYDSILTAEKTGFRRYHYELTRGAVGCYLSHKEVYKRIANQKQEFAFVFEDDVRLSSLNLLSDVNQIVNSVPKDWDILLLGCVCFVCGKFSTYYDVNKYFLMHGYIIKRSSAKKILNLLNDQKIEQQIDAQFSDLAEQGILKIYCLRDKLAVQWDMGTNIQVPVKNIKGINPFHSLN